MKPFRLLALVLSLFPVAMYAQTAEVGGAVQDPSGAVIVKASVEFRNQDTGVRRQTSTNNQGYYSITGIDPGKYDATVQAAGFKTLTRENIVFQVSDKAQIDFKMQVGQASENVSVDGSGQQINTTDASVSTVIDRQFVANIPLNGRSLQDLISLTPGVVTQSPQAAQGIGISGDFSVNGQRTESNYYTVDGVSANTSPGSGNGGPSPATGGSVAASTVLGTTQNLVSVDALQEFRVESSTYSAEYGRSPGGQFSLVTRSGTNAYHGNAFDYLRNNYFDANDWFNDYYGIGQQALRQNDFGGTVGGPIIIPRLYNGKDRTFFFASYEGLRLALPQTAEVQYVPDTFMRQQAPASIAPILNAFPIQNGTDYGSASLPSLAEFIQADSSPSQVDATSIRIDEIPSPKFTTFFRFAETPSTASTRVLSSVTNIKISTHSYTAGVNSLIAPSFSNLFRIGYSNSNSSAVTYLDSFGGAVPSNFAEQFGINTFAEPEPVFAIYFPSIGSSSLATGISRNTGDQWNIVDIGDSTFGHHHLRYGFDYRRIAAPLVPESPLAEAVYESTQSILTNSADSLVIFKLLGSEPIFNQTALFIQDEWHLSKSVNLSMGLRWEADPPPASASGNDAYTLRGNFAQPSTLTLAPRGTSLWNTSWFNVAPRLGIAWKAHGEPAWETVVRAGGGVFFDSNNQEAALGFEGIGFTAAEFYASAPLPVTAAQLNFSTTPSAPYTDAVVYAFPEHLQLPYTLQWNVSVQQALGKSQALTLSYVGANGRRLEGAQSLDITALNPNFGSIEYFESGITSSYNALQVQFQRTVSHGLGVLAAYTWSHSLDFGSNYSAFQLTRGNSDFDLRHNVSMGLSWELPKVRTARLTSAALNGWGVDARVAARTSFPVTLQGAYLTDPSTGSSYYGNVNLVQGQPIYLYGSEYPGGRRINPAAFSTPQGNDPGDAARNFVRGFGETQANLAARREFVLEKSFRLQFRAEVFNLLNHPNFGVVDPTLTDALFGEALQMLNQSLGTVAPQYQQGGPRSMQFALKLQF